MIPIYMWILLEVVQVLVSIWVMYFGGAEWLVNVIRANNWTETIDISALRLGFWLGLIVGGFYWVMGFSDTFYRYDFETVTMAFVNLTIVVIVLCCKYSYVIPALSYYVKTKFRKSRR